MSFDEEEFAPVIETTGEYARMDALNGHLVIVYPIGYVEHSPTKFSQPGKRSDAIVCDVIDLDAADDSGAPGKLYRNTWWRGARLIMSLRPRIGSKVLGIVGKGVSTNGMNPPWVLNDASADEQLRERARQWGRAHANFVTTPFEAPLPTPVAPAAPAAPAVPRFPVETPGYGGGYPQSTYPQGGGQQYPPQQPPQNYPPQGQPQWGNGQQPAPSGPGYPPPQNGGYGSPVTQEDMDTLAAMRQARQSYGQQGYPTDPPF